MTFAAKVRAVHRSSALLLFGFALLHLVNHVVGVGGVVAHQNFMDAARWIYRTPIAEPILVVAIAAQVATGAHLIWQRWGLRTGVWPRLQAISGAYLAFYLVNHTVSVLTSRWILGLESDFYLAASVLTAMPLPLFFAPYYGLGVLALFVHIACAARHILPNEPGTRTAVALVGIGTVVAPLTVAVFTGAFFDIEVPVEYDVLVDLFL